MTRQGGLVRAREGESAATTKLRLEEDGDRLMEGVKGGLSGLSISETGPAPREAIHSGLRHRDTLQPGGPLPTHAEGQSCLPCTAPCPSHQHPGDPSGWPPPQQDRLHLEDGVCSPLKLGTSRRSRHLKRPCGNGIHRNLPFHWLFEDFSGANVAPDENHLCRDS